MPSPPLPLRNLDWTDRATAHQQAHKATLELSQLAQVHRDRCDRDAVWTFLTIHHCISLKIVAEDTSSSLLWLNTLFIERCIESHANLAHTPQTILWKLAALAYRRMPNSVVTILTLALAHIHDDLSGALADVLPYMDIPKADYDRVYTFIIECLDGHAYTGRDQSLKELFLKFLVKHFPGVRNDLISDFRDAVFILAHESVASEMVRSDPTARTEATAKLARAYWEARGGDADDNWSEAEQFLDSV